MVVHDMPLSSSPCPTVDLAFSERRSRVPADNVFFGQLFGMADHLTFTLAANGTQPRLQTFCVRGCVYTAAQKPS